jgi:hypothetical protein
MSAIKLYGSARRKTSLGLREMAGSRLERDSLRGIKNPFGYQPFPVFKSPSFPEEGRMGA